ncbi:YdeI/OmpD-associated family protein [Paenibacillus sp. LHD-38]|uniref:YdeI/OmpD-associated family protein n=1 Tax=Paenibacillus sp. LHD-38 TaxID=3072143 RepID=UPI00280EAFC6|nr:YdeI/OmpD-associated family protein [Paenibacillus sp. LHD-38]MDQ8736489.1 YdeI/OmpD-associated family protein [Paenibacillus sp. LHD-38]
MDTSEQSGFIDFTNPADWEAWLANHYDRQEEVWLRVAKKDSGIVSITIPEALDVALCYGWIDSHRKGFNEAYYLQRYSPRRPKSPWSMINVKKAEKLMESARMKAPGYAEIRLAQADGRWKAAYESQKSATIPPALAAALEEHGQAKQAFIQLDKTAQYAVFLPLLKATTAKSRVTQLQKAIAKLEAVR